MKKLISVLFVLMLFVTPALGQSLPDDILDLPLTEIMTGTRWHFCTQAATDYTGAATTYTKAYVDVTAGHGNGDYTLQDNAGTGGGREVLLLAQDPLVLTGNGTATHICVVDVANTDFLGCAEINNGTGKVITDYTTETATYDGAAKFQMRDVQ
jgi:hypothetical protein